MQNKMHQISCLFRNIEQKTTVSTGIFSVYLLLSWRAPGYQCSVNFKLP